MIEAWLEEDEHYTGTWIYDRLVNQGYSGSYETVKRKVRGLKKQRQKIAYVRFETNPGHQAQVAPAYAAWVKGKVERPYTFIREGFWRGYGYVDTERANRDLAAWMLKKDERIHGTTHEKISDRFDRDVMLLVVDSRLSPSNTLISNRISILKCLIEPNAELPQLQKESKAFQHRQHFFLLCLWF
jgi:hypothetical protein